MLPSKLFETSSLSSNLNLFEFESEISCCSSERMQISLDTAAVAPFGKRLCVLYHYYTRTTTTTLL